MFLLGDFFQFIKEIYNTMNIRQRSRFKWNNSISSFVLTIFVWRNNKPSKTLGITIKRKKHGILRERKIKETYLLTHTVVEETVKSLGQIQDKHEIS